jgi:hypothetical protein
MIPICNDPALTYLKSKGYNVVQLPKADLLPTQLLVRTGSKLHRLGGLTTAFVADPAAAPPPINANNPGPSVAGQKSANLDIGIGLNILGGLISSLGGSTLGLSAAYSRARSVQFEFTDTLEDNCEMTLLDEFLAGAHVNPLAHAVAQMLEADDVFVITSTLKSSKINVKAQDSNKTDLKVDVPVIQQAVGGNLTVSAAGAQNAAITYEGKVPLVFGFQAVRLIFDAGKYKTMQVAKTGSVSLESVGLSQDKKKYVWLSANRMIAGDL